MIVVASATWKDVEFEPDLSASVARRRNQKVTVGQGSFTRHDFKGVRAFEITGSTIMTELSHNTQLLML